MVSSVEYSFCIHNVNEFGVHVCISVILGKALRARGVCVCVRFSQMRAEMSFPPLFYYPPHHLKNISNFQTLGTCNSPQAIKFSRRLFSASLLTTSTLKPHAAKEKEINRNRTALCMTTT